MTLDDSAPAVSNDVYCDVQRFLNNEVILLDCREYQRWFALTTEDIRYLVMAKVVRDVQVGQLDFALIDEDAVNLRARVDQISNPKLTHAENPPTLTRRFVSLLEVRDSKTVGELTVRSNILVYRSRLGEEEGLYSGERQDILRKVDDGFRLVRREVRLDHSLLRGPVSTLF